MELSSTVESLSESGGGGRQLVVGVHDTEASLKALKYVVEEISRDSDVIHVVTVVPCLLPDQEIFHGIPGTSYKFQYDPVTHLQQMSVGEFLVLSCSPGCATRVKGTSDCRKFKSKCPLLCMLKCCPWTDVGWMSRDPRPHHELDEIATAREFLKDRVEPILEGTAAKHKLHLLVDTKDTPAKAFGETITKTAQAVKADMVVVGGRDAEPGEDVAGLGAVAHWLTKHPPGMPLILVPDGWQPSRHVEIV